MELPKKLLVITFASVPEFDGHTPRVTAMVRALRRFFSDIDVVAGRGEHLSHVERFHTARLLRVPLVGNSPAEQLESFRRAVHRQIESEGYDVVHGFSPVEGMVIRELREATGYRVVYEGCTFAVADTMQREGSLRGMEAELDRLRQEEIACASEADLVIVHTEAARQWFKAQGVQQPTLVVPSAVNIDAFDWEFSARPTVPRLLCLGHLAPWRDVPTVLEALSRVLAVTPVRLHWLGEPDEGRREKMLTYATQQGLGNAVLFGPPVEPGDLPRVISAASICLAPAAPVERYEVLGDQPPGILEYIACRRPVVAARTEGIEEVLRDGVDALMYTPGDATGLANVILFLIRNYRHRRNLARRGYRRIRENFTESAQRRHIVRAYHQLLGLAHTVEARRTDLPPAAWTQSFALGQKAVDKDTAEVEPPDADSRPRAAVKGQRPPGGTLSPVSFDTQPHVPPETQEGERASAAPWLKESQPAPEGTDSIEETIELSNISLGDDDVTRRVPSSDETPEGTDSGQSQSPSDEE